ncbi:MAG: DUF1566 domain-containing protein [Myxococcaceae bacterium]|nr:DUF1566 domain-containing protein [Myxococcaceae bacterium]MBH2005849.1 DUF1566 domain-containing protein [Myxococcaceae bacterium]
MNFVFAFIFLIFAWSPTILAWNLLGYRPAWLQDAWSEVARMGQQIRDSVREVKPLSLGSAWVPLTRIGDDYIAQMIQRDQRIQELRQKIHRLRQIDKASEASAAEEELLRLIELGALPEKRSKAGALKIGLELKDTTPGELSLPASKAKDSVPGLRLVPGTGGPPPQPNPLPADVRNDLPDPGIPWGISGRVFRNKTLVPNGTYFKAEILPTDPEWRFIWRCFYHDKPTKWGLSRVYCVHDRDQTNVFEANIALLEKDATAFKPTWDVEPRADQRAVAIERWKQAVAPFSPFHTVESDGRPRTFKNTKVLPLWHGSDSQKCHGIANSGFKFSGKLALEGQASFDTDDGYFGSGIYFTNSARYAGDIYSRGDLMMAWVSMTEPFPIVGDPSQLDMALLSCEGAYKHYNAHYIPVFPMEDNFDCAEYYPCLAGQMPVCDELVIFQRSQALPRYWIELQVEHPAMARPSQAPAFVEDLIPVLMQVLQQQEVDADKRLRNVLNRHLERLLKQARDDDLEEDQLEMHGQLAQLFNAQDKMDKSVRQALIGASSSLAGVPVQASQVAASVTRAHASVGFFSQLLKGAVSFISVQNSLIRTQAMRSDPFKKVSDWYQGPRDAQEVPVLEWERTPCREITLREAQVYATRSSSAEWRLPTVWELEALYQQRDVLGVLYQQGVDHEQEWYWSSTEISGYPERSWVINLDSGRVAYGTVSAANSLRCVRLRMETDD